MIKDIYSYKDLYSEQIKAMGADLRGIVWKNETVVWAGKKNDDYEPRTKMNATVVKTGGFLAVVAVILFVYLCSNRNDLNVLICFLSASFLSAMMLIAGLPCRRREKAEYALTDKRILLDIDGNTFGITYEHINEVSIYDSNVEFTLKTKVSSNAGSASFGLRPQDCCLYGVDDPDIVRSIIYMGIYTPVQPAAAAVDKTAERKKVLAEMADWKAKKGIKPQKTTPIKRKSAEELAEERAAERKKLKAEMEAWKAEKQWEHEFRERLETESDGKKRKKQLEKGERSK